MERGEGENYPKLELVHPQLSEKDKIEQQKPNEPEYKFGDKISFRDKNTGQVLEQVIVGVDHGQLRVMERQPDGTPGTIQVIALESVIQKTKEMANEDNDQKVA